MFNETSYFYNDIDCDGLGDDLTPSQRAKYDRLVAKGKAQKAAKKMIKWGAQGGVPGTGYVGGPAPPDITRPAPTVPGTEAPATETGGGFLEGEVFGIPMLYIAIGLGAFLLLKKR